MSTLPKEAIAEYQNIYKKIYGKTIPFAKAVEQSNRLINLILLIEKPLYENEKLHKQAFGQNSQATGDFG